MNKIILVCMVLLYCLSANVSSAGNLTDNGNGTVTDSGTLLTWQQGENSKMTWVAALSYCEGLSLAGFTDWRLPNHKELLSLVDDTKTTSPAIDATKFPGASAGAHWTSTSDAYNVTTNGLHAWIVIFTSGHSEIFLKTGSCNLRCVRGGGQ